jgi:hypothetical protein
VQLTHDEWEFIGPYLPIGEYGPYPERLRQQFEGVIWRFKTGGQWREMPQGFGAWSTVHNRFGQWRDAGVFEALRRKHRGVPRDHPPGTVDQHMPGPYRQIRRPQIAGPRPAGAKPLVPDLPQRVVGRDVQVGPVDLAYLLMDQAGAGGHPDSGPALQFGVDREDRLPDLRGDFQRVGTPEAVLRTCGGWAATGIREQTRSDSLM